MLDYPKNSNIDKHIGQRLRIARSLNGLSQVKLGKLEQVTFQQIQKYEKGTNRISASRLLRLANILQIPVSWFYEGLETPDASASKNEPDYNDLISMPETQKLVRAYYGVENKKKRQSVYAVLKSLAG